uniref:GDSL esterase/lipase 1-like n=1 Tax=Tanacetum cinerariifolium TaxID=118510 RepID=A0A699JF14_TANCI|nr:GDSL esterase/lipase 1-like [Tanacetum cinerariifolium]
MEDGTLVRKLLNAVPDRYMQIVVSIEQYSDLSEMTFEEAIGRLKTYEERIKYKGKQVDNQDRLLFTRYGEQGRRRGHGESNQSRGQENNFKKETHNNSNKLTHDKSKETITTSTPLLIFKRTFSHMVNPTSVLQLELCMPIIPAYLEPNNDFTHGANFASGGAGALISSHAGFVVDLQTQLRYFCDLVNYYRQNLGDAKSRKLLSAAVYLFSCGANDYQSPYYPYTHEQYVDIVTGNMTNVIKGIYEKGRRKFRVVTAPLIGCWPGIRIRQSGNTCNTEINELTRLHNQALAKRLEHLEKPLEGFMYAKFDISTAISYRMKNPSKYGFKEAERACCGSGPFGGIYSCGGMRRIKEFELCDNATDYLFFDSFHPNELASHQFAETF